MKNSDNGKGLPKIDIPEGLSEKIKKNVPALAAEQRKKKMRTLFGLSSVACLALVLVGVLLFHFLPLIYGGAAAEDFKSNGSFDMMGDYVGGDRAPSSSAPELSDGDLSFSPSAPEESLGSSSPGGENENGQIQAGLLTAGEWCDNDNFPFFGNLMQTNDTFKKAAEYFGMMPTSRITVTLRYEDGTAAVSRRVTLLNGDGKVLWKGVTDHDGVVYLFVSPFMSDSASPDRIAVEKEEGSEYFDLDKSVSDHSFVLTDRKEAGQLLDLMLLCDTTGSMGDELEYLKVETEGILRETAAKYPGWSIRFSVCFYRDIGDSYVVKLNPFTSDLSVAVGHLKAEYASGGGDTPEAVHTAMYDALNKVQWDSDADVKLMMLLLDAPTHPEADDNRVLREAVEKAAAEGVRIIGIAGSDTDKTTEYMLRSMSILSGGSYVFLTNDSGIGNDHMEPTVGEYTVKKLNALLVEIIGRYLGGQA